MTGALFYQPTRRWHTAVAFTGAILIHFGVIVLAGIPRHEPVNESGLTEDAFPPIIIERQLPDTDPTPPDVTDAAPTPEPANDARSPEEHPTPVPVRRQSNKPVMPIQKPRNSSGQGLQAPFSAKVLAVRAPRPEYPYEARRQKITGEGIALMNVDPVSGSVADVTMLKSTGSPVLDNATLSGFRRWRFKPGSPSKVRIPITFTMTGAQY